MRRRIVFAALVLALVTMAVVRLGRPGAPARQGQAPGGEPAPHAGAGSGSGSRPGGPSTTASDAPPVWDAARWQPGDTVPNVELLALDGRTAVRMLDRGANRPLILIVATTGSPALDRCASRWRELFEIYKDRVEFLTVFVTAPDVGGAVPRARVRPAAGAATGPQAVAAVRQRTGAAMTFVQCNDWRIPVLVDGMAGAAAAAFGTAPQVAVLLDEGRRRLGAPVAAEGAADLDTVNTWLRHRFAP